MRVSSGFFAIFCNSITAAVVSPRMNSQTSYNPDDMGPPVSGGMQQQQQQLPPPQMMMQPPPPPMNPEEQTFHEIINGIQTASMEGATRLPSRDIPMSTEPFVQDQYVQPNYVPQAPPTQQNYIEEYNAHQQAHVRHQQREHREDVFHSAYEQFQVPLLLAILYFLFQMPIFKQKLVHFLPMLVHASGQFNLYGLLATSLLFGVAYYVLTHGVRILSRF